MTANRGIARRSPLREGPWQNEFLMAQIHKPLCATARKLRACGIIERTRRTHAFSGTALKHWFGLMVGL